MYIHYQNDDILLLIYYGNIYEPVYILIGYKHFQFWSLVYYIQCFNVKNCDIETNFASK